MRTFLQGCHVSAGCDGTWQECLVFHDNFVNMVISCDTLVCARYTHTLFVSLGIVVLWWDALGDGCVGGGLLALPSHHNIAETFPMYNGFGHEQDWELTPTPMSPVQLHEHVKSHVWFVQKTWPIYELDGLFSLLWLARMPKLFTWTPTLAIENRIYLICKFLFPKALKDHFCGCCTVRLNLQDVLLWYFPKCQASPLSEGHWAQHCWISQPVPEKRCDFCGDGLVNDGLSVLWLILANCNAVSLCVLLLGFNNSEDFKFQDRLQACD